MYLVIGDGCQSFLAMSEQVNLFHYREINDNLCSVCARSTEPQVCSIASSVRARLTDCENIVCIKL